MTCHWLTQCERGKATDTKDFIFSVSVVADLHSQVNPMPVSGVINMSYHRKLQDM